MPRIHLNVSIDLYVLEESRANNINFSSTLEDALRAKLAILNKDLTNINRKQLEMQLKRAETKLLKTQQEVSEYRKILTSMEEKKIKAEEERLKSEEDRIKAMKSCKKCGREILEHEKKYVFEGKIHCKGCFMAG